MIRYMTIVCSVLFVGLIALPCQASAARITEKTAAIGEGCDASGEYSTAMGYYTTASGPASTAMGLSTTASGYASTAMGCETIASEWYSTAIGLGNRAEGVCSFAAGANMSLEGPADYTFVWGHSTTEQRIEAANAFLIFPAGTQGRVGIGTKDPQNLLDLGATQGKKLAVFQKTDSNDFYGFGISSATLEIYAGVLSDDTSPAMVVKKSTGRIGIGTKDPDYKLEVIGDAAKTSGGTTWINSSDVRLKDITGEYQRGLEAITSLRPVTFFYKHDNPRGLPTEGENIGLIAQEVQAVFPEAVSEGSDGYLDFNMHPVNVAVINAIKELKTENDALRNENLLLRQDIEKIKAILGI